MTEKEKAELKERIAVLERKVEILLAERQRSLEIVRWATERSIGLRP